MTSSTITFSVPGMTCGHCVAAVTKEVTAVVGVASVAVDLASKLVTVTGSGLERAPLEAAIEEAGFDVA
jgi:copper chaperone